MDKGAEKVERKGPLQGYNPWRAYLRVKCEKLKLSSGMKVVFYVALCGISANLSEKFSLHGVSSKNY